MSEVRCSRNPGCGDVVVSGRPAILGRHPLGMIVENGLRRLHPGRGRRIQLPAGTGGGLAVLIGERPQPKPQGQADLRGTVGDGPNPAREAVRVGPPVAAASPAALPAVVDLKRVEAVLDEPMLLDQIERRVDVLLVHDPAERIPTAPAARNRLVQLDRIEVVSPSGRTPPVPRRCPRAQNTAKGPDDAVCPGASIKAPAPGPPY